MNKYYLILSLLLFSCVSSIAQTADDFIDYTMDLFHQSDTDPEDNGNEKFIFGANGQASSYDADDGEWESLKFSFTGGSANWKFKLDWGGSYAELTTPANISGNFTYRYFDLNRTTGEFVVTDTGTGTYSLYQSTMSAPINRFFKDDFSNTATTSENFFLGNGGSYRGLTVVQDVEKGEFTLEGLYTGDPDDSNHRWVDISANSLLPLNRSWIIDADPYIPDYTVQNIETTHGYGGRLKIEWDGDAYMEIGLENKIYDGGAFFYFDPPGDSDSSFYEYANIPAEYRNFKNFRIKNNADDYEITCSIVVRESYLSVSPEEESEFFEFEVELFRIFWEEGSYATKTNSYYDHWWNWRQIPGWKSLGDQYVQPSMAFQLPNQTEYDQETNTENVVFKNLEAGLIGFRSFNVIHDPEIVDFDGGDEFPEFYNNLSSEVSSTNIFNRDSRYYLLKGLHELVQIVQSSEANSLKQLLVSLGFDNSLLNFSLSEIPLAGEYEFEINRDFQTGNFATTTQYFMIPRVESVIENFSKVTEVVTIETSMTGMDEAVVVDATDVKVLNAMANLLGTFAGIEAGYNFDLNLGHLQDLDMELEEVTVQSFRERYPNLLGIRDVSMHRKAKVFLDAALSTYKTASTELRTQGRYETFGGQELDYLFVLHEDDLVEEEEFLEDLQELHDALSADYILEDDDPELNGMKISLSALFEGGLDLAKLLPAAEGDQFVSDQLTDPTLGGILPGASYDNNAILKDLREGFYEDEIVLGQRVLPDTLEEALAEFDPKIYLELNDELLDNWNVYPYLDSQSEDLENQARQHFEWRGYWEGRRYFYYPYEKDGENGSGGNNNQGELVFSTTNGLPVLYKDEKGSYNWSSNLDGIVLWTVVASEGGDKSFGTAKFIDGHILYGFDTFSDDVADFGTNKVTYTIDDNGYIKSLEGDGEYQYYNAIRLEHGGIGTIQNDQGPDSVADNGTNVVDQWFFVSKESANSFLNSTPRDNPDDDNDHQHGDTFAPHGLADHQSISSGIIKELGDFQFSQKSYYLDSSTVVINDFSQGEPGSWRTVSYEFKAIDNDSALVTVFEKDGTKTITTVNYTKTHYLDNGEHEDSGDIEVTQIDSQGSIFFSNAVGQWACRDLDVSEIPSEYLPEGYDPDDKDHHSDEISIFVSGGQNTSAPPYYVLKDAVGNLAGGASFFEAGKTYKFIAAEGFNSSHPFNIGAGGGSFEEPILVSPHVSGGPLKEVGDKLILSIPANHNDTHDSLSLYCTTHPETMRERLTVINHNTGTDGPDTPGTGNPPPGTGGYQPYVKIPVSEVSDLLKNLLSDTDFVERLDEGKDYEEILAEVRIDWAEKMVDVKDNERFVYVLGLSNLTTLYFTPNERNFYSVDDNSFDVNSRYIRNDEIPSEVNSTVLSAFPDGEILDLEFQFSYYTRDGIYIAFVKSSGGDIFQVAVNYDENAIILILPSSEAELPWRPLDLPAIALDYLKENYKELVATADDIFVDMRPLDGQEAFVVFLNDGREVFFSKKGAFIKEFDPFNITLDAGLKLDATRSTDLPDDVHVSITPINNENPDDFGSMLYQIILANKSSENVSRDDLDISDSLREGEELTLTFTYEVGPPRYFIVSGANVTSYKHRMADWDKPGSFTIKAETVAAVASASGSSEVSSMFGITVEMGGDRFYDGAIFETDVVALDVAPASFALPWDRAASFTVNGTADVNTTVKAYLPRSLLSGAYGIMDPREVRAGLVDADGNLAYIDGSVEDAQENVVGYRFSRTPYEGHEPNYDQGMPYPGFEDDFANEFKIDDDDLGIPGIDPRDERETDTVDPRDERETDTVDPRDERETDTVDPRDERETDTVDPRDERETDTVDPRDERETDTVDPRDERETDIVDPRDEEESDPVDPRRSGEVELQASKFDFDGDGLANSYLKVEFIADKFPAEVQIGDPWVDPYKNVDESQFGTISGMVNTLVDGEAVALEEFDVWFFKVPQEGDFMYGGEPVFFLLDRLENGMFTAKLPQGEYHMEAFAYDFETDTPYKPKLAGGNESPTVFTIDGNTSVYTGVNFTLEEEYRMSHEMAQAKGTVAINGDEEIDHIFFDFFPVPPKEEDGNNRLTDYPVFSFGVDRDGKLEGMLPVGRFEVEVFSPDNSVSLADKLFITIKSEEKLKEAGEDYNQVPPISLQKKALVSVTVQVTDENAEGIWAEVIFVNPLDSEDRFWPMWDHGEMEDGGEGIFPHPAEEGIFSFKVPAGEYKVLAERYDGMYLPGYYGAATFEDAQVVNITEGFSDNINISLQSRPTATVTVQLLDSNTSLNTPIKYAWFDFFDAEDEYAPIIFPHVDMINFEDNSFDGSYTLKVPGGTYKIAIGAPGYEGVFRVLDNSGAVDWQSSSWENGASVSFTDGESSDLGTVRIKSFGLSDAELFGFEWMDDADEFSGGATINGFVKTSTGDGVPKARIIARTVDYSFWFDHVQTRNDGSFSLNGLPEGEYVVFAEPPFDSDTYQGFRESNETHVLLSESETKDLNMTLRGSNVYGRILFPQKNRTSGETERKGLGNAFVWAYEDEDQDGEPDWNNDFSTDVPAMMAYPVLNEAFGETDEKGFFSFYLEEAGKYSMRIELPGQLSALSPEPIGFTIKNPSSSIKLGNAVKIDWKSDTRATSFDIERKAATDASYVSLFTGEANSSKPGPQAKSFVDSNINPGLSYTYRVIAETETGRVAVDSDNVKVSAPFIYLAPPSKTISGKVLDDNGSAVANAEVVAWREEGEGWSSTFTGSDGSYELVAGPGKWEVTVYRPYDVVVDWNYLDAPKRVKFADGKSKQAKSVNFVVSRMGGGKVSGTIVKPDGVSGADLSQYIYIDVFDSKGMGQWGQPDENGDFSIPLLPGQYDLSIWVDPQLSGFGSPEPVFVRVDKNEVNLGQISLTSRNVTLNGTVKTNTNEPLRNIHVWAWSEQGGWAEDTTNLDGNYSFTVSPGRWEVGFDLPVPQDGSVSPYFPSPPKRIKIKDGESEKSVNFIVKKAGAQITGVVYESEGKPVSDINGWVYAREYQESDDGFFNILAEVPLSSKGTFSFPGVPGDYLVGIWLPPGSGFGYVEEKRYRVDESGKLFDAENNEITQASFQLSKNDSYITGTFKLDGNAVSGIVGEVFAMRLDGDGWQSTPIETNGTYELLLSAGNWALDYYIESDSLDRNIPQYPSEPTFVQTLSSSSVVEDFVLSTASASISGTVKYESNNSAVKDSPLFVWAYREGTPTRKEYWNEVETDENGTFTIPVYPEGKYEVGAILTQELRVAGFLDSLIEKVDLTSGNFVDLNLTISKPSIDNYIAGTVFDSVGNPLPEAFVYAWTDDGREVGFETNSSGQFMLTVPKAVWRVGAEYSSIDDNGSESYYSTPNEIDVNLVTSDSKSGLILVVTAPDFEIPEGKSETFNPNEDFVTILPDGTELTIPGGAVPVGDDVTEVRVVITPTAKGLSKSANEKPADYAYAIELYDNNGKRLKEEFKKDVILKIAVDINASLAKGMDINNIEGMYYSTSKGAWDKAKSSTWDKNSSTLTLTTDHFTTFSTVGTPDIADISKGQARDNNGTSGDWYSIDWFGTYYDATSGWIYHNDLGWLYAKEASDGNYWFYDSTLGWLWTGPTYFDSSDTEKSFLYSATKGAWFFYRMVDGQSVFFEDENGEWSIINE